MNQRTSVDNLKKFNSQAAQLNPQLQAVLGNLDVQLDDELARYRRKKRLEAEAPQPSGYRHRSTTPKNLEVLVTPGLRETPTTAGVAQSPSEAIASEFREPNQSNPFSSGLSPFSPEAVLPEKLEASLSANRPNIGDRDPLSSSANLADSDSQDSQNPISQSNDSNDYLESSEQLLGSLEDSTPNSLPTQLRNRRRRRRSLKSLLSPLSVGVTLLFVLTLGTIASVISGKMGDSRRDSFAYRKPVVTAENSASSASSPTQTPLPEVPRSPNLADKEFVSLDLDTLGTLNRNSEINPPMIPEQSLPTVPISPAPNSNPTNPTTPAGPGQNYPSLENLNTAILPQSVQDNLPNSSKANSSKANSSKANSSKANSSNANSSNANSSNANAGNNSAVTTSPAASPTASPATSSTTGSQTPEKLPEASVNTQSFPALFYVVIDYQNEDSLYLARQVIPDAYLRDFPNGVKVQMAAFEDTASAQNMVQYLKEQGFAAQVYQQP
jgi:hypothetical protein